MSIIADDNDFDRKPIAEKKKSSVIDFEANIADAEYIKLEVYVHTGNSIGEGPDGNDGALIMADAKLWS